MNDAAIGILSVFTINEGRASPRSLFRHMSAMLFWL